MPCFLAVVLRRRSVESWMLTRKRLVSRGFESVETDRLSFASNVDQGAVLKTCGRQAVSQNQPASGLGYRIKPWLRDLVEDDARSVASPTDTNS